MGEEKRCRKLQGNWGPQGTLEGSDKKKKEMKKRDLGFLKSQTPMAHFTIALHSHVAILWNKGQFI